MHFSPPGLAWRTILGLAGLCAGATASGAQQATSASDSLVRLTCGQLDAFVARDLTRFMGYFDPRVRVIQFPDVQVAQDTAQVANTYRELFMNAPELRAIPVSIEVRGNLVTLRELLLNVPGSGPIEETAILEYRDGRITRFWFLGGVPARIHADALSPRGVCSDVTVPAPSRGSPGSFPLPSAGTRLTISSSALGEERVLWVWTPPGYSRARPGLPVLYVLDAETQFQQATSLVSHLSLYLRMPEMIVVGIPHVNRTAELTPAPANADRFRQFLTSEARPFIERNYNTAPFSLLVGHSLGGLFAAQTAFQHPTAFSAFAAMSPALDAADSVGLRSIRAAIEQRHAPPRHLFVSLSGTERPGITSTTRALVAALQTASAPGLEWHFAEFPTEHHQTVPYVAMHAAMRWLFGDWWSSMEGVSRRILAARTLAPFNDALERLRTRYGYDVQPAELHISILGDRLYQASAFDLAIELFARRVALYPESPEAHDELARGYLAAGQHSQALASFERAVALAESQRHQSLNAIRERLARARAPSR